MSIFLVLAPLIDEPELEYFYILGFSFIGILVYYPFVYKKMQLPFMGINYYTHITKVF